jgi:AraC-like DNA-binding protein
LGRLIPASTAALRLLVSYVEPLHTDVAVTLSAAEGRVVVDHVAELLTLIIGVGANAVATKSNGGGVRAARLAAVKSYIRERLGAVDLCIDDVAGSQSVSPRYVRKLFEGEGGSFSTYVAGERLARAHTMLTSARFRHLPISAIAFEVGFGDLSYFNRLFRRSYQATPSDVRVAAFEELAARGL